MDVNYYRRRLLELEASLSSHIRREIDSGREQLIDTAADAGDESVADESESEPPPRHEGVLNTEQWSQVCRLPAASRRGNWFIGHVQNGSVNLGSGRRTLAMIPRRVFLGAAALLPLATDNAFAQAPTVTPVHVQDLPDVRLDGWTATVVEVRYPPAGASQAHRHPGFVLGYVLEGEIRFGVDGGEQTIYRANQVFYEPPGVLHSVSANASPVNPARFLAIVVAEKGAPITVTP
jgi:quercetin dioxygenase-like cupin family protein